MHIQVQYIRSSKERKSEKRLTLSVIWLGSACISRSVIGRPPTMFVSIPTTPQNTEISHIFDINVCVLWTQISVNLKSFSNFKIWVWINFLSQTLNILSYVRMTTCINFSDIWNWKGRFFFIWPDSWLLLLDHFYPRKFQI